MNKYNIYFLKKKGLKTYSLLVTLIRKNNPEGMDDLVI